MMRALARDSDEFAPSESFENKIGTASNAKRVPTLVGGILADRGYQAEPEGETLFPQRGNKRANPWWGRRDYSQQEPARKFPPVWPDSRNNSRGMLRGRATLKTHEL